MFEGIEFETRSDEWQPTAEELAFQREVEDLTAEQSWSNPNEFGHIETSFGAHLRAMERRSEELGIYRVYSDDDKNVIDRIQGLQETYLSRDEFIQLICECPEEFGYSPEQANALFGHNHDHRAFDLFSDQLGGGDVDDIKLVF